jgi:hypothetical protein
MNTKFFFRSLLIIVTSGLFFVSCDKDFNEIGSDVIGENNFGFERNTTSTVVAFNQPTGVVQSNNLPINALGIYNNPVFGKTKANFVSQLQMASVNPTFDPALLVSLDSVVLTVPYFSKRKSVTDGKTAYELDSIAGSGPINLKIFESGYTLLDLDPSQNFEQQQKYYTDQDNLFNSTKIGANGGPLNNSSSLVENAQFVPSPKEFVKYKRNNILVLSTTEVESRSEPRMSLKLDKAFFQSKIINAPAGSLQNNNVFKNYFKGIYFQVDDALSGTLLKLNFRSPDANITMYYTEHASLVDKDNNPATPKVPETFDHDSNPATPEVNKNVIKTFVLNFGGNTVNLIEHTPTPVYANALSTPNPVQGDEKLYIKGGAGGSVALIDLFGPDNHGADGISGAPNGVADELDIIKSKKWLINEANLTFYINKDEMGNIPEPQRVYLYDAKNKQPLIDYADGTTTVNPKFNKFVHGGILERETAAGGRGIKYKIRITNHVRNLVNKDSTNVRLGISVTESIAIIANSRLKNPVPGSIDRLPVASVINPFGTVLFGSKAVPAVPEDKRLKLEIYYTKPN